MAPGGIKWFGLGFNLQFYNVQSFHKFSWTNHGYINPANYSPNFASKHLVEVKQYYNAEVISEFCITDSGS